MEVPRTQPSTVTAAGSIVGERGMRTLSSPSKCSERPKRPEMRDAPLIVPLLALPDVSTAVVPLLSSRCQNAPRFVAAEAELGIVAASATSKTVRPKRWCIRCGS